MFIGITKNKYLSNSIYIILTIYLSRLTKLSLVHAMILQVTVESETVYIQTKEQWASHSTDHHQMVSILWLA